MVSLEGDRERRPYPAHKGQEVLFPMTMAAEPLIGRLGCHSKGCRAFLALRVALPPFSGCDRFRAAVERFHHSRYLVTPLTELSDA